LTSEITTKVRASDDPQVILQTAVSELRRVLQASRAQALVVSPAQLAQPEEQDSGRHSPSALDKSSTEPTSEHSQSPQPPSGASANG